jgi:transposase InsO family protein
MGRLTPENRVLVSNLKRQGIAIKVIMNTFGVSRVTIWYWSVQDLRTRFNIPNNYKSKISIEVESSILFFRSLGYGTARIQQRLISAPDEEMKHIEIVVQQIYLSRPSINKVLKKHKLNGYSKKRGKAWKFFRAKYPNELWQLDLKEFKFEGKKYYFVICIDDYSRFLIVLKLFNYCPTTKEITSLLQKLDNKPNKILTDNGGQFREQWKEWCKEQNIEAIFAHPYYPQDKGKVERTNRNIAEELINLIIIFHKLLNSYEIEKWVNWFNEERFHRGVNTFPARLYVKN